MFLFISVVSTVTDIVRVQILTTLRIQLKIRGVLKMKSCFQPFTSQCRKMFKHIFKILQQMLLKCV